MATNQPPSDQPAPQQPGPAQPPPQPYQPAPPPPGGYVPAGGYVPPPTPPGPPYGPVPVPYPARLEVDYPATLDRLTSALRMFWIIPIAIVLSALSATATSSYTIITETGEVIQRGSESGGGIAGGLFLATMLMIVFRQRYPRWWFDFALQFQRFSARVAAYGALLTDRYPSTEDEQSVHLELDYPDVPRLNPLLPIVKWILVLPHVVVLAFLWVGSFVAIVVAWFAILFTGRYPRGLFDYVVGVGRWSLRVAAYATLLITDRYPPFSLS